MPIDKSAPLRLDDFGRLDAVAIVAKMDMLKSEKRLRAFRRCGIRLGDGTNAVDSRAGTDAKIRHIDAGLEIRLYGARIHSDTGYIMDVREHIWFLSSTTNPTTGDIHTMRTTPPNPMGLALPPRFYAPDLACRHLSRKAVALGLHHIHRGASYSTAPYFPSLRPLERRAVREYIRGLLTLDEKEHIIRDLAAHAG
ncbi:hypothetical protein CNYM01_03002 [Colletotrichum nymphaeae SA-01]|uniref:Uncharacterized protein n=1 Tax=Colletotrichum nymphaeae SA-01 TaxID=1460502 RepID=A0A135U3Z0_9PEZI|nr:hypothetical protein CNYM01_03002 [Colletotrichum nymphaeae SA-01]